jgi:hypothetical protein
VDPPLSFPPLLFSLLLSFPLQSSLVSRLLFRTLFPHFVSDAKLALSDRIAENVDALHLNTTKLPFLLNCKRLRVRPC